MLFGFESEPSVLNCDHVPVEPRSPHSALAVIKQQELEGSEHDAGTRFCGKCGNRFA